MTAGTAGGESGPMRMDWGTGRLYDEALSAVRNLLSRIEDGDLGRPTPCAGWDLRTLAAHMVGQNRGFAAAIASGDAAAGEYALTRFGTPPTCWKVWDESAERLLTACAAADSDRQVRLMEIAANTTFSATVAVRIQLLDTVVHTWDLATSLGLEHRPEPDVLEVVAAIARSVPGGPSRSRPGAAFGPSLPATSSDAWVTALAHLGRRSSA